MTSKNAEWWIDAIKYVPGWLAFIATLAAGIGRMIHRRSLRNLGPADEVRDALEAARDTFMAVIEQPRWQKWFDAPERRNVETRLGDVLGRVEDRKLGRYIVETADSMAEVCAWAPRQHALIAFAEDPPSQADLERRRREREAFDQQSLRAEQGLAEVRHALARLNHLERRTIGR